MKKKVLFSMLLLFVGVSMQAQSIASKQMDERFNDGTKFPLGWFGEGWKVENGKAKAKATEDSGNSGFPGMGGGTGTQPSTNPSTTPSMNGMPGMGSMFGGNRVRTYLLTPPYLLRKGRTWCSAPGRPTAMTTVRAVAWASIST